MENYFGSAENRLGYPTGFAVQQGVYVKADLGTCPWYLRVPGESDNKVMYVKSDGEFKLEGSPVQDADVGVRPVIRIYLGE